MSSKKVHYVDNAKLFDAMKTYLSELEKAKKKNTQTPQIPAYIGECIMKISTLLLFLVTFK